MALTPNSAATSYLTVAEFLLRIDDYLVAQLSLPGNDMTSTLPSDAALAASAVVQAALDTASGQVEAAMVRGGRYLPTDLVNLTGVSLAYLKSICAALALQWLREKRGINEPPLPSYDRATAALTALENGEQVFAFIETEQAGLPKSARMTQQDFDALGLASRAFGGRFMGIRSNQRWPWGE